MPLRIVTDSTADLDQFELDELGIAMVPLTVRFGDDAYLDRLEINAEDFYTRLANARVLPHTSQPSVGQFHEAFALLAAQGADEILAIHLSSKLSGTFGAARVAARQAPAGCHVSVLDSRTIARGLAALVRCAAEVARQGGSSAQAQAAASALIRRHTVQILLDTLEYLQRGGRIGRARSLLGSILNVKPIVRLEDGEVVAGGRVRSRARGVQQLFETASKTPEIEHVVVEHSGGVADAEDLAHRLRDELPGKRVEVRWLSPVVGVHAGPNAIGTVVVQTPHEDEQAHGS
jgi:DegV family protein with EDD domain